MQDKEMLEVLKMIVDKMEIMEQEIKVLNEKQNNKSDNELQSDVPSDGSKQIPITGL